MKLMVRKLWYAHDLEETVESLFRIPQMRQQFDGFAYDGEMRPRGIKICSRYWPADAILDRLPDSEKDVYMVLTSMDLKGDYGRIHGKGRDRKAIASSDSFSNGFGFLDLNDPHYPAMTFHEIGHALGLLHHDYRESDPCVMSDQARNRPLGQWPRWSSIEAVQFCEPCYRTLPGS